MKTSELLKELANELTLEADYYGAYIDEVRKIKCDTFKEFEERMKPIEEKFPLIEYEKASILLMFLNYQTGKKLIEQGSKL